MNKLRFWLILTLLWILFAQIALATQHTSITLDEPLHITSGYACLLTGDYRLVEEHPPLLKMLQAAPLLLADPPLPDPRTVPGWDEANLIEAAQHVVVPYRPIEPLVFAARVPTMLIAILLAALVFRWTTDAFGKQAALLALFLLTFDPNILAHAGVAATDLGATCAIFAATYTFWRWLRQLDGPSRSRAILAGAVLGLALGVKSTTLMLGPIFISLLLFGRPPEKPLWPYIRQATGIATLALLTLWASYRFEIGTLPGIDFPIPLASHLKPLLKLQTHMREGHSAFLMGQNYHHGDWRYFPLALLLKTPLLTLGLLAGATLRGIITGLHPAREENQKGILSSTFLRLTLYTLRSPLLLFPLFYFGVSLSSGINIGYRHLL
ncbi:MAG TPA: phospholipid carrier-dependent glycosyltransferase, partial [Thermoflexia bacterium]|nr:phospholipid carrier-dependent glycosyltransferase [Thermoflexia bacterium]